MAPLSGLPALEADQVLTLMKDALPPDLVTTFLKTHDVDCAYAIEGLARFRINLFRDHRGVCAVLRQIPCKIMSFEQLGLPPVVAEFCNVPKGLVLVTGPTGSGKSTTLAAMVDHINRSHAAHIITLEDPIEFVHESQRSLVNQREIGAHTAGFHAALRAALREDPDVVLVGELRDHETIALALEIANTGHLVFATLHTSTAVGSIERILGVFPSDEQPLIRTILADVLQGVVSQTLCRRVGGGRVAALEILVGNHAVSNLVREGKTHQIQNIMAAGKGKGNILLNDALASLVKKGAVDRKEALDKAVDKAGLTQYLTSH